MPGMTERKREMRNEPAKHKRGDYSALKQGYNARLDESLGMRTGKESSKKESYKARRDESKGMEKASGKKAYKSIDK